MASLNGCDRPSDRAPDAQVLRRGLDGEPSTLDPAAAGDAYSTQVIQDLYEGLTAESASGDAIPAAAASWEVDPSGTRYTFHLRPDARWSNGEPLRARDFVNAWRRVVDPKEASPLADNLRFIHGAAAVIAGKAPADALGVSAPSDELLRVTLDSPTPYLPKLLAHPAAYPVHLAGPEDAKTRISNGPYVVEQWVKGSSLRLRRNPYYWDREHVRIASIQYQFWSDEGAQFAAYRAGQLDVTDAVPVSALAGLRQAHSAELVTAPYLGTVYYGLNLRTGPLASRPKARQALCMAIDRQRLVESLGFGQLPAYSFVPSGISTYAQQPFAWRDLSDAARVAEAKRLYAEAGYSPESPLRIRVLFNSNVAIKRTAIIVAEMWREVLGVQADLTEEEYRAFLVSRRDPKLWDVARLAWVADFEDSSNFLDVFRSNSTNNDPGYANPAYDALIDGAATTVDDASRIKILEAAERSMLGDYPIAPLYHMVSTRLVKPYVLGVHPTALNYVPSKLLSMKAPESN